MTSSDRPHPAHNMSADRPGLANTMSAEQALPAQRELVAGSWATPASVLDGVIDDASTGQVLEPQRASDRAACDRALAAAADEHARGFGRWSAADRATALEHAASAIEARAGELALADAVTTGALHSLTRLLGALAARIFRTAAEVARDRAAPEVLASPGSPAAQIDVLRLPRGPAAVIAPWNAPSAIAAHKVASALAAGCPVVLKPSEHAPLSCQLIVECAAPYLPPGALQLVLGGPQVGALLVEDPRIAVVSFTGGLAGGRAIAAACAHAMKPAQLELGGNNPFVVLASADVALAADALVAGLTTLNGQWCRAVGRVVVDRAVSAALLDATLDRLSRLRIGAACDPTSEMGPLAHAAHRRSVAASIERLVAAGATAHAPSPLPALGGHFLAPTLVTGAPLEAAHDEIFGPVATWHPVDGAAEALAVANASPFGLAAYVFGDPDEAAALAPELRAGGVQVNRVSLTTAHPRAPRAAWGLSGLGDEGVVETFEHFRGSRTITRVVRS